MSNKTALAALAAAAIPAPAALAAPAQAAPIGGVEQIATQARGAARQFAAESRLVAEHVRLKRELAHLRGDRLDTRRYAINVATLPASPLRRANARLRREIARSEPVAASSPGSSSSPASTSSSSTSSGSSGSSTAPAPLQAIARCESGGNPSAVGGGGAYRGKYQFSRQTWQSVGGSGDPAAASVAEQDRRAAVLYSRGGASSWPVCGR